MVRYTGSKRRLVKHIMPIILKDRKPGQWYVEPMVGGCNSFTVPALPKLGADANCYLIAMWRALQYGWQPPTTVTETEYQAIKAAPDDYPPQLVGFVGVGCSFGGKWFGGYARYKDTNYAAQSGRSVLKQLPDLRKAVFRCSDYKDLDIPPDSIIYVDPPYAGTTNAYLNTVVEQEFWYTCSKWAGQGHKVYVSNYHAPKDWIPVWQGTLRSSLDLDTGSKHGLERLYVHRSTRLYAYY